MRLCAAQPWHDGESARFNQKSSRQKHTVVRADSTSSVQVATVRTCCA